MGRFSNCVWRGEGLSEMSNNVYGNKVSKVKWLQLNLVVFYIGVSIVSF